ncbi:MAG: hypothetical protein Q9176_006517 [Flavoplaca citrina]
MPVLRFIPPLHLLHTLVPSVTQLIRLDHAPHFFLYQAFSDSLESFVSFIRVRDSPKDTMSRPQRRWTADEDSSLQREVEAQMAANDGTVHDWNSIAQRIEGRSNKDCRKRFYNGMVDGLRKGPWTSEEDQMLEPGVQTVTEYAVTDSVKNAWDSLERYSNTPSSKQISKQCEESSRYSVLKKQTIEIPPDAPSCCVTQANSSRAESSRTASQKPTIQKDGGDLLNQFDQNDISDLDTGYRRNIGDHIYPISPVDSNDPFHSLETNILSNNTNTNLFDHDFLFDNIDFGTAMDPGHNYDLDSYNIQSNDAFENQSTYIGHTEPSPANTVNVLAKQHNNMDDDKPSAASRPPPLQIHRHTSSGTQWQPQFPDANPLPREPTSQQQGQKQQEPPVPAPTGTTASPTTPNWQTTIRFSEADATTVSSVIGVLTNSQAKFIYETH